jgi:hypothetical protein
VTDLGRQPDSSARRSHLLGVKLRALVSDHVAERVDGDVETFPNGAALLHGGVAWVLVDGDATRSLGAALAWAVRRSATSLEVIAETDTSLLARRAEHITMPTGVWHAEGRLLLPAVAEALIRPEPAAAEHTAWIPTIVDAGAEPNIEHGVVVGEVRGLEVCRVVDQPTTGYLGDVGDVAPTRAWHPTDGPDGAGGVSTMLEVGIGPADREAFQMLHGDIPTGKALADVVASVASHRGDGTPQHPLNRIGRERLLRWRASQRPSDVGMASVAPGQPPLPRRTLKEAVPCVADAVDLPGRPVCIVFSSGVDLDLIPYVVDVQLAAATTGVDRIVVALPARDLLPLTQRLAELLVSPIEFVTLD